MTSHRLPYSYLSQTRNLIKFSWSLCEIGPINHRLVWKSPSWVQWVSVSVSFSLKIQWTGFLKNTDSLKSNSFKIFRITLLYLQWHCWANLYSNILALTYQIQLRLLPFCNPVKPLMVHWMFYRRHHSTGKTREKTLLNILAAYLPRQDNVLFGVLSTLFYYQHHRLAPQLKKEGKYFVNELIKTEILYHFITVYILNKYFLAIIFCLFNREINTKCKGICEKYMGFVHTPFNLLTSSKT